MSLGTDRLFMVPINMELTGVNPLVSVSLPLDIFAWWSNNLDAETLLAAG